MFGLDVKGMKKVTSLISQINSEGWENVLAKELLTEDRESCLIFKEEGKAVVKFYTVNLKNYLDSQTRKIQMLESKIKELQNG